MKLGEEKLEGSIILPLMNITNEVKTINLLKNR
jgi:hypothetical protein